MARNASEKIDIQFLCFEGCPNAVKTRSNLSIALEDPGVDIEPIDIIVGPNDRDCVFPGSPTVLVNGVDIYTGYAPQGFHFSCRTFVLAGERTGVLSESFLRARIGAALNS